MPVGHGRSVGIRALIAPTIVAIPLFPVALCGSAHGGFKLFHVSRELVDLAFLHKLVAHALVGIADGLREEHGAEKLLAALVGTSSEQISRIGWRAEVLESAFVAKRPVNIPHGSEGPEGRGRENVGSVHEGALGMAKFAVVAQSVDKEIACKGFDIHHFFRLTSFDSCGETVYFGTQLGRKSLFRLLAIGFTVVLGFGRFDTHGQTEVVVFVSSVVVIEFEERPFAFVFEFHAVGGSIHLFGEDV